MSSSDTFKSLVEVSVEKAVLGIGKFEFDSLVYKLKEDYNCEVSDCLYHPEYLKEIFSELFGNTNEIVLQSIRESFKKTNMEKPLENFLTVLDSK